MNRTKLSFPVLLFIALMIALAITLIFGTVSGAFAPSGCAVSLVNC